MADSARIANQNLDAKPEAAGTTKKGRAKRLWVNAGFLRKLTTRPPQTILPYSAPAKNNYYLKLADLVLGPIEKRKGDRNATALRNGTIRETQSSIAL